MSHQARGVWSLNRNAHLNEGEGGGDFGFLGVFEGGAGGSEVVFDGDGDLGHGVAPLRF